MHDRLTWLCVACGVRQVDGPACASCHSAPLAPLAEDEARTRSLAALERRLIEEHEDTLVAKAQSVRRAPLHFAAGAAVMLIPLSFAGLILGPVAGAATAAAVLGGGLAIGAGVRTVAPRWLLGKEERGEIDREIDEIARRDLPVEVIRPPASAPGVDLVFGRLEGTPAVGPFSDEPLLAARVVGRIRGHVIDDAWFAPGELFLARGSEERRDLASVVSLAWLAAPTSQRLSLEAASPALRERLTRHLLARGVTSLDGARLELRTVAAGEHVALTGTPRTRAVPDGYRDHTDVVDLLDAVVRHVGAPLAAVPGPFVPPIDLSEPS